MNAKVDIFLKYASKLRDMSTLSNMLTSTEVTQ